MDAERVWSAVECAREDGFATEQQENETVISCLAVALLRGGAAVAAVSVTARAERMTPARFGWLHGRIRDVLPPLLPEGLALPPRPRVDAP